MVEIIRNYYKSFSIINKTVSFFMHVPENLAYFLPFVTKTLRMAFTTVQDSKEERK